MASITRDIISILAIFFLIPPSELFAQTKKKSIDTTTLNLSKVCFIDNSYVLKVKNYLVYVPDTTYERYCAEISEKPNLFRLKKGKITPYSRWGRGLLSYLAFDRSKECCVYDIKNQTWLDKLIHMRRSDCPPISREIISFGEKQLVLHMIICYKARSKRKR